MRRHALRKDVDHRLVELRDVVGLTAAHELVPVDNDGLIDPLGPGVPQVGAERRPRRHPAAAGAFGLDDGPRAVADHGDGLARIEERADEIDRAEVGSQRIGVHHAAGQVKRVELVGVGMVQADVDVELLAPVGEVPRADARRLRRDDLRLGTVRVELLARLGHLDLLEAVGDQDRDLQAGESIGFSVIRHDELLHVAGNWLRYWCTNWTAMAPSPTADATRLTEPERTSPAANTPGWLVSSMNGWRGPFHLPDCASSGPVRTNCFASRS